MVSAPSSNRCDLCNDFDCQIHPSQDPEDKTAPFYIRFTRARIALTGCMSFQGSALQKFPIVEGEPIELKCWSVSFRALKNGTKRFEYRRDDRDYRVGSTLWQREWNPDTNYTGDELYHDVTFIIKGGVFGIPEGYCIMSVTEPRVVR